MNEIDALANARATYRAVSQAVNQAIYVRETGAGHWAEFNTDKFLTQLAALGYTVVRKP